MPRARETVVVDAAPSANAAGANAASAAPLAKVASASRRDDSADMVTLPNVGGVAATGPTVEHAVSSETREARSGSRERSPH